jgi:large subunit ribosomal protein L24
MSAVVSHIKKGDIVIAISGEDAAGRKQGKVLQVLPAKGIAVVEGFNLVKRHMRKTQDKPDGGIVEKEAPLPVSRLRVYEAERDKAAKKAPAAKAAPKAEAKPAAAEKPAKKAAPKKETKK